MLTCSVCVVAATSSQWAIGTRLARVMRLLRVIRVIRVFATCSKQRNPQSRLQKNQQSAIGKRINEMLVRSMIIITILLCIIFPLLSFDEQDHSRDLAFYMLSKGASLSTYPEQLKTYRYQGEILFDPVCLHASPKRTAKTHRPRPRLVTLCVHMMISCSVLAVQDGVARNGYRRLLKVVIPDPSGSGSSSTLWDDGQQVIGGSMATGCLSGTNSFVGCPPSIAKIRCSGLLMTPDGVQPNDPYQVKMRRIKPHLRAAPRNITHVGSLDPSPDYVSTQTPKRTIALAQAYWDVTKITQRESYYNIVLTCLLTFVILVMYVLLSLDVAVMVVQPIESMVSVVRQLSEDPTLQIEAQSKV